MFENPYDDLYVPDDPAEYGLDHPSFRAGQYDAISAIAQAWNDGKASGQQSFTIIEAPTGCHAKGQKILMYDGSTRKIEDIKIGTCLMGDDNSPRIVKELFRGTGQMYKIVPVKGEPFIVNEDHILTLQRTNLKKRGSNVRKDCKDGEIIDVSVREYLGWSNWYKHIYKLKRVGADFPKKVKSFPLPLAPYFLGIILGDGTTKDKVGITTEDKPIADYFRSYAVEAVFKIRIEHKENNKADTYVLTKGRRGGQPNSVLNIFRGLGLGKSTSGTKFIPFEYKTGDRNTRLQVLAGLIDTDGSLDISGCYDYISKSEQLANDVAFVSRSLGLAAYVNPCEKFDQNGKGGTYYRVIISGNIDMVPCILKRKQANKRKQIKDVLKTGFSVEKLGIDRYYGFELDGNKRYLLDDFTVTHNTGKSAIAYALAKFDRVTVLVGTLNLLDQYINEYGFAGIKGRQNYLCAHPGKKNKWKKEGKPAPTAGDCHYSKMHECPASEMCHYLDVKTRALASNKLVVTYAYASLSYKVRERSGFLIMDEGHLAAEHLLGFAQFTISKHKQQQRGFPAFPSQLWMFGDKKRGGLVSERIKPFVTKYLNDCMDVLDEKMNYMSPLESEFSHLNKEWERISRMIENLSVSTWFLDCHPYVSRWKGKDTAGFRLRALDARTVADRLWSSKQNVVLMSATIGDPEPLAEKLGIRDYDFRSYPHPVPVKYRPVENLRVKRMTHKNLSKWPSLYRVQAASIAEWIDRIDPGGIHRGIILTSSYKKINMLHTGLEVFLTTENRRLIVQYSGQKIDAITQTFLNDRQPGDILIASIQGFGQGLNLKGELARWVVIAGLPHDNPSDPYAQALKSQSGGGKYMWSKVYSSVPQAAGRVNRGSKENGEYLTNWTALADGSALSPLAKRYYPQYFLEAIKEDYRK